MEIEYYKKNVYGNLHLYIKDVEIQSYVIALTHMKTITVKHIIALEKLGNTFKEVLAPQE